MAELHPRLEAELVRQLAPVAAPDSLWQRIHEQRRPLRVRPQAWPTWSIAAASLLVLLAGLVWRLGAARTPHPDLETLARVELRNVLDGTQRLDIESSDRGEIQNWVRWKLGVDLRLSGGEVGLCGAKIFRAGQFSGAVITYRIGNEPAALIVTARSETAGPRHTSFQGREQSDVLSYSWSRGGADYALASSDTRQPQRPCLLCHAIPALVALR